MLVVACVAPGIAIAATPHAGVAARDLFAGAIGPGSGAFSGASGHVKVALVPGAGSGNVRRVVVTLSGHLCRRGRCRTIGGRLHGSLARPAHQVPDTGQRFTLQLTGKVAPLGTVSANGRVNGTGFIARGHETLVVTISVPRGALSLSAQSPLVPGFTSP